MSAIMRSGRGLQGAGTNENVLLCVLDVVPSQANQSLQTARYATTNKPIPIATVEDVAAPGQHPIPSEERKTKRDDQGK